MVGYRALWLDAGCTSQSIILPGCDLQFPLFSCIHLNRIMKACFGCVMQSLQLCNIGEQRCPNLSQTIQTNQTNFWAKIPTSENHAGNSIGIKRII